MILLSIVVDNKKLRKAINFSVMIQSSYIHQPFNQHAQAHFA